MTTMAEAPAVTAAAPERVLSSDRLPRDSVRGIFFMDAGYFGSNCRLQGASKAGSAGSRKSKPAKNTPAVPSGSRVT